MHIYRKPAHAELNPRYSRDVRDGPGGGGISELKCLLVVKSAAFMLMGQLWHFQPVRYVNAQREKPLGGRCDQKENDKQMNERGDERQVLHLRRTFISSTELIFFIPFFFCLFFWTQRNR